MLGSVLIGVAAFLAGSMAASNAPQASTSELLSPRAIAKLFRAGPQRPGLLSGNPKPGVLTGNPKIVCGLTVWQVDPAIDPGIRLRGPDRTVDFKIRRVAPPTCGE
jgi:hypothetical protein